MGTSKLDPAAVCTLPRRALSERIAWIRDEILPHARRRERLADGIAWELEAAPGLAANLDQLVALERDCGGGIVFAHMPSREPGRLRLEIRGVDPDADLFRELGADSESTRAGSGRARLAKAGGLGLLGALVGCCAVSLAASALLGGAAATAFARLEEPWAIGLVALAAASLAWWWLGRRSASRSCGPAC